MDTVVGVDLINGVGTPWSLLKSDEYVICTGWARPPENTFLISQVDLVGWLCDQYGPEAVDADVIVTQAGEAALATVCDSSSTFVRKVR